MEIELDTATDTRNRMMITAEDLAARETELTGRTVTLYQRIENDQVRVHTGLYGHATGTALLWTGTTRGGGPRAMRTMLDQLEGLVQDEPGTVALADLEAGRVLTGGPLAGAVVTEVADGVDVDVSPLAVVHVRTPTGAKTLCGAPDARVAVELDPQQYVAAVVAGLDHLGVRVLDSWTQEAEHWEGLVELQDDDEVGALGFSWHQEKGWQRLWRHGLKEPGQFSKYANAEDAAAVDAPVGEVVRLIADAAGHNPDQEALL